MSDKELLELAAKAAGIPTINDCLVEDWNPLTSDGDALRLAVKLGIDLVFHKDCVDAYIDIIRLCVRVDVDNDYCASTRRAIVRAAAEIGKGMK